MPPGFTLKSNSVVTGYPFNGQLDLEIACPGLTKFNSTYDIL